MELPCFSVNHTLSQPFNDNSGRRYSPKGNIYPTDPLQSTDKRISIKIMTRWPARCLPLPVLSTVNVYSVILTELQLHLSPVYIFIGISSLIFIICYSLLSNVSMGVLCGGVVLSKSLYTQPQLLCSLSLFLQFIFS